MTAKQPDPRASLPVLRDAMPDFYDRPTMPMDLIAEAPRLPVPEATELTGAEARAARELFIRARRGA